MSRFCDPGVNKPDLSYSLSNTHSRILSLVATSGSAPLANHSEFAIIDSGTPLHIFHSKSPFLHSLVDNHSQIQGFDGSTTRAVAKGTLSCRVTPGNGNLIPFAHPDSALLVPDAVHNLFSVKMATKHQCSVHLNNDNAYIALPDNTRIPLHFDADLGLWLLPLYAPSHSANDIYPALVNTSTENPASTIINAAAPPHDVETIQDDRAQSLALHHRLGHPNSRLQRKFKIDGIPQGKGHRHFDCPQCLASKARRHPRPPPSQPEARPTTPWTDIHCDLSGKMIPSIRRHLYFCVFLCRYSGAVHVELLTKKSDFILAYKNFVAICGKHPSILRTDLGGEFMSQEITTLLVQNYVRHVVCAANEHFDNGPAENVILTLRNSANAMMLTAHTPWRLWDFSIQHAAYLRNATIPSRADPSKSIYELLTGHRANLTAIPPLGSFVCIYVDRRSLPNQSLGLPSVQGAFLGICTYRKILGYCIFTADHKVMVTRHNLSCDPYLYPFKTMTTPPPAWQPFARLTSTISANHDAAATTPVPPLNFDALDIPATSTQNPSIPPRSHLPPSGTPSNPALQRMQSALADDAELEISDEEEEDDELDPSMDTTHSTTSLTEPTLRTSKRARHANTMIGDLPDQPKRITKRETYESDHEYKAERDRHVQETVIKHFPGHGNFKGTITEYYPTHDTYHIHYEDNDDEIITYKSLMKLLENNRAHQVSHTIITALTTAIKDAAAPVPPPSLQTYTVPQNHTQARAAPDAAGWLKGEDIEIDKLYNQLKCWTVIPRSSIPPGALVMDSRWTYAYKTDSKGALRTDVHPYRSRFVGKGFTQQDGVNCFETFAPVISFVTLRLLFALTALPHFDVTQYDISVAFIEAEIDKNAPPIYCECAPGRENRKEYVYLLHRYLYGMKDAPRGYNQLFTQQCKDFGLYQCTSDECVFVLHKNNSKSNPDHHMVNINADAFGTTIPESDRIYPDCPHSTAILIVASYVDDNLCFSNCPALTRAFETHINRRMKMKNEGKVHWYLSVKYDRDPATGAVTASQELYIDQILKKWGLENCNSLPTPFPSKVDTYLDDLAAPVPTLDATLKKDYQSLIGQLLYLQTHTVPEISWTVSQLSRYMIKPGPQHMAAAKKLLRYLQGRKKIPLRWCASDTRAPHRPGNIYGYADASFADDRATRKSSIGYVFLLNNGAVSWRSSRTSLQVLNAAEAELVALCTATQEAVFLRKLCQELGFIQHRSTTIYEDCQAAVALSKENRFRKRSKHIALRWHYIAERQARAVGDIHVVNISRNIMLADIFASPRPAATFLPFRKDILGSR